MAPDPSLPTACKDVNKRKTSANDPTQDSQHMATPGLEEKVAKAKQIQQRKHASGWVNNDGGQITINSLTLYGYRAQCGKKISFS